MTRILFYHGASDRLMTAAAWLGQLVASKRRATVYVPDPDMADRLDRLLWTHAATSFLPHCRAGSPLAAETPVIIADQLQSLEQHERLLNLDTSVPGEFARFEEVVEIVSNDDSDRLPARNRYRFYRDRGYELQDRKITEGF